MHIHTIDNMHLGRQHVIATFLLTGTEPALVDPGPASTLPALEAGLAMHGHTLGDIRHILLTHIHLDHAAATGAILARYPNIRVYVHERGAPHLIDPKRLLNSARQLYGALMATLWGDILPVPPQQVAIVPHGGAIDLGARHISAYDAPGHAKHHLVYFEAASGAAFVGDNTGVRLPSFDYVRPATPPPDIDLEQWQKTLDLIANLNPQTLYLTHFGAYHDAQRHIAEYRERLLRWSEQVRQGLASGADEATQIAQLRDLAERELSTMSASERDLHQQASPGEQSWAGLARYWRKHGDTLTSGRCR
ncbi:MBL fold metallo-hydrolase [Candidatus Gracilibacteria bacterium]|nr:MBL fold metallo-hydrolase [Candidatus Gracilibacteria bacterium]